MAYPVAHIIPSDSLLKEEVPTELIFSTTGWFPIPSNEYVLLVISKFLK